MWNMFQMIKRSLIAVLVISLILINGVNAIEQSLEVGITQLKTIPSENPHFVVELTDYNLDVVKELEVNNFKLLRELDTKTWVVSTQKRTLDRLQSNKFIKSVRILNPEEKITKEIRTGRLSYYSLKSDSSYILKISCYNDVSVYYCKSAIEKYGKIIGQLSKETYFVEIKKQDVIPLADEDEIELVNQNDPVAISHLDDSRIQIFANPTFNTYKLNGSGINISMWEVAGIPNVTHADLIKRVAFTPEPPTSQFSDHATVVAGIMGGDGSISSLYTGIASGIKIVAHTEANHLLEYSKDMLADDRLSLVSQNSWTFIVNASNCNDYGNYDLDEEGKLDEIIRGDSAQPLKGRRISIVYAVGNERDDGDCNLNNNPYNSTPRPSTAKNVITVGAVPSDNIQASTCFSSWGPTDDGRLKPEIVAPGDEGSCATGSGIEYYLTPFTLNSNENSGTSFSAPQVSGAIALMQQQTKCTFDNKPLLPSTLKAILVHTTTDVNTTGPDYRTGYGLLNVTGAVDAVIYRKFREDNLSSITETDKWNFTIISGEPNTKVTLTWDDPKGSGLKNDLDLTLISPSGTHHHSWYLNPNNPSNSAQSNKGDHLNNVEQIVVNNPETGEWTIVVNSSAAITFPPQQYSLVYKRPFSVPVNKENKFHLFSIPVLPYNSSADAVFCKYKDSITIVYHVNTSGNLNSHICGRAAGNSLTNATANGAFYINASKPFEFEIAGDPTNQDVVITPNGPAELHFGYNQFRYMPVNDFLSGKEFSAIQYLKDYELDNWQTYTDGSEPDEFFNMRPGVGYKFINSSRNQVILELDPPRSCSTLLEDVVSLTGAADYSKSTSATPSSPFTIYGNASAERLLNDSDVYAKIVLQVGSLDISNYTMGELNDSRYKIDVPMGVGLVNQGDTARLYIGGTPINEDNVTIGASGSSTAHNITVNVTDGDGDSYSAQALDCNDSNSTVNPDSVEVCDLVDNDCDGMIDEGCAGLRVMSLNEIKNESLSKIFEFKIRNADNENLYDILWTVDLDDGTTINSTLESSLALDEELFVFMPYNYSTFGSFDVTANASSLAAQNNEYSLNVKAGDLFIDDFIEIFANGTARIFSFRVTSNKAQNVSINWTIDLGDGTVVNSNTNTTLLPDETAYVYTKHVYSAEGTYNLKATANGEGSSESKNITTNIKSVDITNLGVINVSSTKRTFEFIATNLMSDNLSAVGWSFDTGNGFKFNSSSNITLVPVEGFSVFVDYDYGTIGSFVVNASARNNSVADYRVLNVSIT